MAVKNKERSEVEYLRGELRRLKKEVAVLRKELAKRIDRDFADAYEVEEEVEEEYVKEVSCPKCGKELEVIDLNIRLLHTCKCGYRKVFDVKSNTPSGDRS